MFVNENASNHAYLYKGLHLLKVSGNCPVTRVAVAVGVSGTTEFFVAGVLHGSF